ncbi:hypothetical protein GCM10028801_27750 [Nocardioides maradonensis]
MSFLDDAKNAAEGLVSDHPDQAEQLLNKAEGLIDQQTGGKFSDQIAAGGDKLGEALGLQENQGDQAAPNA